MYFCWTIRCWAGYSREVSWSGIRSECREEQCEWMEEGQVQLFKDGFCLLYQQQHEVTIHQYNTKNLWGSNKFFLNASYWHIEQELSSENEERSEIICCSSLRNCRRSVQNQTEAAGPRDVIVAVLQFSDFGFHFRMNYHHVVLFCFSSGETDRLLIAATHISFRT